MFPRPDLSGAGALITPGGASQVRLLRVADGRSIPHSRCYCRAAQAFDLRSAVGRDVAPNRFPGPQFERLLGAQTEI